MKQILLNDEHLRYTGRIDDENPMEPEMIFPASSLEMKFTGKYLCLTLTSKRNYCTSYLGTVIDQVQKKWRLNPDGETIITLIDDSVETTHEVMIFKRMDSSNVITLKKVEVSDDAQLLKLPPKSERKIEVYGDSVSAGELSEATEYMGKPDPVHDGEYSNSYYSYAWITARMLHAQLHDVAQGGIPLMNHTGWVAAPYYPGMEYMWDKVQYHPEFHVEKKWDFTRYIPQVVIVAIGQNDSNPYDFMKEEPKGEQAGCWKRKYGEFLMNIREKYPRAYIICTTTIMWHDSSWDHAIEEVVTAVGDSRICHFLYQKNGTGTPGHIRIGEAQEMAKELTAYIESLVPSVWEEGKRE